MTAPDPKKEQDVTTDIDASAATADPWIANPTATPTMEDLLDGCPERGALEWQLRAWFGADVDVEAIRLVPAEPTAPKCECFWTDPSTWTHYGSAVEPGSQMEFNPECPVHG